MYLRRTGVLWDRVQYLEVCEKVRLALKLRSLPQRLAIERLRGCERGAFLGEACRLLSDQMDALQRRSEELLQRVSDRALSGRSASDARPEAHSRTVIRSFVCIRMCRL